MKTTKEELIFLKESNYIEQEWSKQALDDAISAWEYLSDKKTLTLDAILKTHEVLMQTRDCTDAWKGKFRTGPVWVGGREGIAHERITKEIDEWIAWVNQVLEFSIPVGEAIKDQHITYEHIHPFFDGNGRTGRIFYNWTRKQVGLPIDIIMYTERSKYYGWFK